MATVVVVSNPSICKTNRKCENDVRWGDVGNENVNLLSFFFTISACVCVCVRVCARMCARVCVYVCACAFVSEVRVVYVVGVFPFTS